MSGVVIRLRGDPIGGVGDGRQWVALHMLAGGKIEAVSGGRRIGIWPRLVAYSLASRWLEGKR